jgi:hypothetical protein
MAAYFAEVCVHVFIRVRRVIGGREGVGQMAGGCESAWNMLIIQLLSAEK